ncbi:MAG: hypothetical protein JO026_02855 [Patescibacteria group bacterium]|nr:hypothetical protein [Patescibacteria group bacterium]
MKLSDKAESLLQRHIEIVLKAGNASGVAGRWPMPALESVIDAVVHSEPFVASSFYARVRKLKLQGCTYQEIGSLFEYPSNLALLTFLPRTRALSSAPAERYIEIYNDLAAMLFPFYRGKPFCEDGANLLLSESDQDALMEDVGKAEAIPKELLAELDGRLWMYVEHIFARFHNLGHEFHGPYGRREKLLVKAWHTLRGMEEEIFRDFPYEAVTCYEFYLDNRVTFDIHNRMNSDKPLAATLTKSYVRSNEEWLTTGQVKQLVEILDTYLERSGKFLSSLSAKDLKKRNAEIEFFVLKPLADRLGEDWHPPAGVYASIEQGMMSHISGRIYEQLIAYQREGTIENVRVLYDPRIPFPSAAVGDTHKK